LNRAAHFVAEAAGAGAQLIVLPELFSGGYWLCERAWDTAEPQGGTTERWLCETAARLDVHLGGSYLLASGEDFFNVFALATPAGQIAGRVPKQIPASLEAYLFRGQLSSHIIESELGPGAQRSARLLGIPAVQANKSGPWKSECPSFFPEQDSMFHGQSEIADSSGETLGELADQEAVLVRDVTMDPTLKVRRLPEEATVNGRWISPVPGDFKMFWIVEALGRRSYGRNPRRREKAKNAGGHHPGHSS
jgi:N-carbamoylputrescine amidase